MHFQRCKKKHTFALQAETLILIYSKCPILAKKVKVFLHLCVSGLKIGSCAYWIHSIKTVCLEFVTLGAFLPCVPVGGATSGGGRFKC